MISRIVGIAAAFSLSATAFLLPPNIEDTPDVAALIDASVGAGVNPKHQLFVLPCPGCAFPMTGDRVEGTKESDDVFRIQRGANSLFLEFSVTDGDRAVHVNGAPLYPMEDRKIKESENTFFTVEQVSAHTDLLGVMTGDVPSTPLRVTAFNIHESVKSAQDGDYISVLLTITGLNDQQINVVPIEVRLLQPASGEVSIMELVPHLNIVPEVDALPGFPPHRGGPEFGGPPPPWAPHHGPPHPHHHHGCTMLLEPLCRIKNMLDSKIDHAMRPGRHSQHGRPCPGRQDHRNHLPSHIKTHLDDLNGEGPPRPHHGRPHHIRPHGGHHGHPHGHYAHHLLRAFAKGMVAVLIPVMAGIAVGMTVSLLGLLVGRLISLLWIRLVRGGRRGQANMAHGEIALEDGEDKAMLAEMEAPPVYENAPAYEVVEKE